MREVTTTVYCDRCGKKIDKYNYGLAVKVYEAAENCLAGITEDLCGDCAVSFKKWLYEGKQQQEPCKYNDNEEGCLDYSMGIGDPKHMPYYVKNK